MPRARSKGRIKPARGDAADDYKLFWRLVNGAVLDVVRHHPEYIDPKFRGHFTASLCKRLVGNLKGCVNVTFTKGRE